MNISFFKRQVQLEAEGVPHVLVTIIGVRGSVPQEMGAKAIVVQHGLDWGTVGGGKVEAAAIKHAVSVLSETRPETSRLKINLNRDLGMTCGGEVEFLFEVFCHQKPWHVAIFGAGHVSQALVRVLAKLDCQICVFDDRPEWLAKLPQGGDLRAVESADMSKELSALPDGAQVVILTKGHASDLPVLEKALESERFGFIGVIGSRSKGHRLRKRLRETGCPEVLVSKFYCPIGLPLGRNQPEEIAISIVSQLLLVRDQKTATGANKWKRAQAQETLCLK